MEELRIQLVFKGLPDGVDVSGEGDERVETILGKTLYFGDDVLCNLNKPETCTVSVSEAKAAQLLNDFPLEWDAPDLDDAAAFVEEYYRNQEALAEAYANNTIRVVYPDGKVEEYPSDTIIRFSNQPVEDEAPEDESDAPEPEPEVTDVQAVLAESSRKIKNYFKSLDEADINFASECLSYENENENRNKVVVFLEDYIEANVPAEDVSIDNAATDGEE